MRARRLTIGLVPSLCALAGVLVFASTPAQAASKGVVGYFGGTGTTGGLFSTPGGVAVNDTTGDVYVVDSGNDRVQELSTGGAFIRTWGLGVVSTGQDSAGTSTVQSVTIKATSGTFTLSLSGQTTSTIAYDATDAVMEGALDALSTIGGVGGSVTVTGGPGDETGSSPYLVTFGGSLRGGAVPQMTVNGGGLGVAVGTTLSCTAGPNSAVTKLFQWLRNGVPIEGASSSTYTTVAGDAGGVVQCQVFALNANAGSTQVSTTATVVSPALATAPPVPPASVAVRGPGTLGALKVGGAGGTNLTCEAGAWTGASSFAYQWYRNGVALSGNGANTSVYRLQSADLASAAVFQCAVTGSNAGGSVVRVSASLATEPSPKGPAAPIATAMVPAPSPSTVAVTATGAPAFEVCNAVSSPQDVCKAGVAGASAGAMSTPQGVAVEQVTGDVYVTDQGNRRVDEFTEDGVFVRAFGWGVETGASQPQVCSTTCVAGLSGANAGEFGASIGYPAVDPSTEDVYVADSANRRVDEFTAAGVFVRAFGWGVVSNATEALKVCTSACVAGLAGGGPGEFGLGSPTRLAVDALGDVYVVDGANFRVQEFSSAGALITSQFASAQLTGATAATAPTDIAVEPTLGAVLGVREPVSPAEDLVYELDGAGDLLATYAEGAKLPVASGLAVGPSGGGVYLSTAADNRVFVLGMIVAPTVTVEAATGSTASEVTLHGTVNPNETPPNGLGTSWQFEYSTNSVEWVKAPAGKVSASTSPVAVTQTITGLEGNTLYYVRLHTEKEFAGGSATSPTSVQFTTSAVAPTIPSEAVSSVAATSASFSAQINPQHLRTTYHFEYDTTPYTTSAAHGTSLPEPDIDIGEGSGVVAVSQHPQDLRPATTYHYRVVATNPAGVTDDPERSFTTQTQGEGLVLPDGRGWEMVSPPNKNGASISPLDQEGGVAQAAADGGAFTWAASAPIGTEPAGDRIPEWSQIFSVRGAGGWSSRDIAGPHELPTGESVGDLSEYKFFSSDLTLGLVEARGGTPLSPEATEKTPYIRDDAGSSYLPLVTAANVLPGTKFGGGAVNKGLESGSPVFQDATPDLSHVVFASPAELTSNALATGKYDLYEWVGGQLQLVNVLPENEGGTADAGSELGNHPDVRQAISSDGSRIIWTAGTGTSSSSPLYIPLYMRDMVKGETVRLDVAQEGVTEPTVATPKFQTASDDGHRVFFTDVQRLTADSTAPPNEQNTEPDLYEFETINGEDEPLKGELTDLTVDHNTGESADVQDLLPGASEDGSYVYLVAKGVLSEAENAEHEKAASGANNLYVLHDTGAGWTTMFIAQLSSEDAYDWSNDGPSLSSLTSRVSPDGRYLAFMSDRELTGYDNHDANSGAADEEVFLYDASTDRLVCASCDPTGARPVGILDPARQAQLLVDEDELWGQRWLAGNIPGWTPAENGGVAFHQSRYLSDSGRLFFNSNDALVPQDVNGTEDVYEYEPSEVGSCASSSVTFSERSGGCVGLISSGTSSEESVFLDASEGGGEVFFLTASKLASQDYDSSLDVYDARECTAQAPCMTAPVAPPECTTADACRAASTPQPTIFGAPPSATFSGTGNSAPAPTTTTKAKAKALTGAQELAKALKACKQKPKKKRPACEKQARNKYGATKTKKKKSKAKKTTKGRK